MQQLTKKCQESVVELEFWKESDFHMLYGQMAKWAERWERLSGQPQPTEP